MSSADTNPTCPECDGRVRTIETESVCEECGLVAGCDPIDRGPEWRSFEDGPDRKRTGAPLTRSRHDRGLSTTIGYKSGIRLTGRKRRQLARMRREHNRARFASKADRNQMLAFSEIKRIVSNLSLPDSVRERACVLFESAQSADLCRGRSLEGVAAAALYATCRTSHLSRTVDEIVAVSQADADELRAGYKALNRELGLPTGPIDPAEYVPRYASNLEVEPDVERLAREHVSRLAEANAIVGKNPSGVAAACLYAAASDLEHCSSLTQQEAGDVGDVAPVTIRSTVSRLDALEPDEEESRGDTDTASGNTPSEGGTDRTD